MSGRIETLKSIFHLTALRNLPSIIEHGLLSRYSITNRDSIRYTDIADPEILDKRQVLDLDKCVPFHFHTHTAFDVAVQKKRRALGPYIYLAVRREVAKDKGFKIIPRHPASKGDSIELLEYNIGVARIDWIVMDISKGEPPNPNYDKHVRMAECVSPYVDVPFNLIYVIFVPNKAIRSEVDSLLKKFGVKVAVIVNAALFTQ